MSHSGHGHSHGHGHGDIEAPGHAHSHDSHGNCSGHGHGNQGHGTKDLEVPLLPPAVREHSPEEEDQRKLRNAVFFVLFFMLIELIGGIYCHSLAILTDAAHMLSDAGGFIVSYMALEFAAMERTHEYSFGFRQAEVLGALLSLAIVWSLTAVLLWEAVPKFWNPDPDINAPVMLIISLIGFVVNVILMQVLGHGHGDEDGLGHGGHGHSHGHSHGHGHGGHGDSSVAMDSALAHVIGDMVQSIGVCLAALCIWQKPFAELVGETELGVSRWNYADPLCTVLFSMLVLYTTKSSAMRIFETLLVRAPRHIDQTKFANALRAIENVDSIHDMHVWYLGSREVLCTCHIMVNAREFVTPTLKNCIAVAQDMGIFHSTFQIEVVGEFDPAEEVYGFHANELSPTQTQDKDRFKRPSFKGLGEGHNHGDHHGHAHADGHNDGDHDGHAHADGHKCGGHGHDGEGHSHGGHDGHAHADAHKKDGHGHAGEGHGGHDGHAHADGHKCDGHGHDGEEHGHSGHDGHAHADAHKKDGHGHAGEGHGDHDGHAHADGHKCDGHGHDGEAHSHSGHDGHAHADAHKKDGHGHAGEGHGDHDGHAHADGHKCDGHGDDGHSHGGDDHGH